MTISWTPEATNSPMTGSRPVSSGVTLMTWPGFRPMGSFASADAFASEVALLATSSACSEAIGLRRPWPIAAIRSAQLSSLGKPSSGRATAGGIKARGGVPALEFAHDQLAIAIDVRADRQHRRFTVASGQRRQVGFWHNHGDLHRSPGQGLETKTSPNFLRIGRDLVVMQDDISHRASPRLG